MSCSGQDENGETIEVEVLDEDGQLDTLAVEATKSLVEVDGNLQIEMDEGHHVEGGRSGNDGEHANESRVGNLGKNLEEGVKSHETKVTSR